MSIIAVTHQTSEGIHNRVELEVPDEKADSIFRQLAGSLMHKTEQANNTYVPDAKAVNRMCSSFKELNPTTPVSAKTVEKPTSTCEPEQSVPEKRGIKGFVDIVCPKCGKETFTNIKQPVTDFKCRECGEEFDITDCVPAIFRCECGASFKYMTNHTEAMFDIDCMNCGSPNAVEYNKQKKRYIGVKSK